MNASPGLGGCLLTLIGLLATPPSSAGADATEPRTGVTFPRESDGLSLVGLGLRTRLLFKIYVAGFYVDATGARRLLGPFRGRPPEDLAADAGFYARIVSDDLDKAMRMKFVYDAGARRVREAFRDGIDANLPGTSPAAEQFLALFAGEVGRDGDELAIRTTPGGVIRVRLNGRDLGTVKDQPLSIALWKVWFGPDPILPRLKRDVADGVRALLE